MYRQRYRLVIDINSYMAAYNQLGQLSGVTLDKGPEAFEDYLFEQLAAEVTETIDSYGPPDFRAKFLAALLRHMGATPEALSAKVASLAATLTAPDYFDKHIVDVTVVVARHRAAVVPDSSDAA